MSINRLMAINVLGICIITATLGANQGVAAPSDGESIVAPVARVVRAPAQAGESFALINSGAATERLVTGASRYLGVKYRQWRRCVGELHVECEGLWGIDRQHRRPSR